MKKTLVLLACLLALAISAVGQEQLTFSDLPSVSSPTLMPNGYGNLNWTNFFYVDPSRWSGAGSGYLHGAQRGDVAFVGGKICRLTQEACYGTISAVGGPTAFEPVSATVAGGFGPTTITVTAYNNGTYLGSNVYNLTTMPRQINFPSSWGVVTQLVIQTDAAGDVVVFNFSAWLLGG